jgi:hypothetical protein
MSYKDLLKKRIKEIEYQISNNIGEADKLREELRQLELREFEEDERESNNRQILLKG